MHKVLPQRFNVAREILGPDSPRRNGEDTASRRDFLCIICPCYNEEHVINLFYREVKSVLTSIDDLDHQIIFVDDGSTDGSLAQLNAIAGKDSCVRVYSLSRNFGHQIALTAGLDEALGDAVIVMDSDLQHPPSLIPRMVELWREGYHVVSAARRSTADSAFFKRLSSKLFYRVVNLLSDTPIVAGVADYCLLSEVAHLALRSMPERHRFLRGMISWMGFRRAFVAYDAPSRGGGNSKYTLRRMLSLALDAIFSFSVAPIRVGAYIGLFTAGFGLVYLIYVITRYLTSHTVQGWASLISVVLVLGGLQLSFVSLIGAYLARVFEEVKGRPLYFFKQKPEHDGVRTRGQAQTMPAVERALNAR